MEEIMPKVRYTPAKGLVQSTGSGFENEIATMGSPGAGVSGRGGLVTTVEQINNVIVTTLLVDIHGLLSGNQANGAIGDTGGAAAAHFGQITTAVNGLIYKAEISCLEAAATGGTDIDLSFNTSALAQNADGTGGAPVTLNGGVLSVGELFDSTGVALTASLADHYIHLLDVGTSPATYSAGKFVIRLYGIKSGAI
jgi:hypothetical protein